MDLWLVSTANPDLELREEGVVLIALPAFRRSVISYIFTQNNDGRGWRASRAPPQELPLYIEIGSAALTEKIKVP